MHEADNWSKAEAVPQVILRKLHKAHKALKIMTAAANWKAASAGIT